MKRIIKKRLFVITKYTDCVNLSVRAKIFFEPQLEIYNNDDPIAFLSLGEAKCLLNYGGVFFTAVIYSLCKKYSIEKY